MIVYLARDIRPFVMYCVNGKPHSSLLIESTDRIIMLPGLGPGSVLCMIRESHVILKAALHSRLAV